MRTFFATTLLIANAVIGHAQPNAQIPAGAKICDRIHAEVASDFSQLREVMDRCGFDADAFVLALRKFNRLGPPTGVKQISLRPLGGGEQVFRVRYEADVFFNLLEAYPHPVAFEKLADLTNRISEGFEVVGVEIIGSADPHELELEGMMLDARRAEFLQRYLEAAGIRPDRIWTSSRGPTHENTPEGRARDRSAMIRVEILREGSAKRK